MLKFLLRLYESEYKPTQGGVCGITCNVNWAEPRDPENPDDVEAHETNLQFNFGWFLHPIALDGKYPPIMRSQIDSKSEKQSENRPFFSLYLLLYTTRRILLVQKLVSKCI